MKVLLFITILFSGLVAGLLYSYSCSVNNGLKALPDNEYIRAMQSINSAIQNPFFFISFLGLLIIYPVTAWQVYKLPDNTAFYFILSAMIIYFTGVLGVTTLGNIPLNEKLARFPLSTAMVQEAQAMRKAFEKPWNSYHTIRMIAAIVSFGLSILSILKQKI